MNDEWIYESPDGGRTITRRKLIPRNDDGRTLMVSSRTWWDLQNLQEISSQLIKDQELRDQHPALEDLWQQYQTMKSLLRSS
jgi:hypothetical protein